MRLFGIYGTGQKDKIIPNIIKTVLQEQEVYVEKNLLDPEDYNGLRVSFCHIDDLVWIIAKLLYLNGPLVLNVAGEKGISIREVATSIGSYVGKKAYFKVLDRVREGDLIADIALLNEVVCPQFTPFDQGLAKTIEFELQNRQSWIK
jgi:nucleoside-diphosphate-sugar epimerase